jgi:hypothetical protein
MTLGHMTDGELQARLEDGTAYGMTAPEASIEEKWYFYCTDLSLLNE